MLMILEKVEVFHFLHVHTQDSKFYLSKVKKIAFSLFIYSGRKTQQSVTKIILSSIYGIVKYPALLSELAFYTANLKIKVEFS